MSQLKIAKIDILDVYPKKAATYCGVKWGIAAYELSDETRGVIDFPIPKDADDIQPVARVAISRAIMRGAFNPYRPPAIPLAA